jgi:protein-tyrosine phosphatase
MQDTMDAIVRNHYVHRYLIHYMNLGLSYLENSIINLHDNTDITNVYPSIYISNYSTSTNITLLKSLGITHIITVNSYYNPPHTNSFYYHYIAAYDDTEQDLTSVFSSASHYIHAVLSAQPSNKILIHCQAGRSRSVSIFIAYILAAIQHSWPLNDRNFTLQSNKLENSDSDSDSDATTESIATQQIQHIIAKLKEKRPIIQPNTRFVNQLITWYTTLLTDNTSTVT